MENKDTKIEENKSLILNSGKQGASNEKEFVSNKDKTHQENNNNLTKIKEDTNIINNEMDIDKKVYNCKNKSSLQQDTNNNVGVMTKEELTANVNIKELEYICRPNSQEFGNPLNYIETLNLKLKDNGACKIIPPSNWRPTELSNFKVRINPFFELMYN